MNQTSPPLVALGQFNDLEAGAQDLLLRNMHQVTFKQGQRVFAPGEPARNFVFVQSGEIRVSVTTPSGREILLYKVEPGETCILTTVGLIGGEDYGAEAVAEQPTRALIVSRSVFEELLAVSARFRSFVFSSYAGRMQGMIALVQDISARHLDKKLARLLADAPQVSGLQVTHQQIAAELNTSREVVTRLLHDFAERGWVSLGRRRIDVFNRDALDQYGREL